MSLEFSRGPSGGPLMKVYSWDARLEVLHGRLGPSNVVARPSLDLWWDPSLNLFLLESTDETWAKIHLLEVPVVERLNHYKQEVPLVRSALRDLGWNLFTMSLSPHGNEYRIPFVIPEHIATRRIHLGESVDIGNNFTFNLEQSSRGVFLVLFEYQEVVAREVLLAKPESITLDRTILASSPFVEAVITPKLYSAFFEDGSAARSDELDLFVAIGTDFPWKWIDPERALAWAEEMAASRGI